MSQVYKLEHCIADEIRPRESYRRCLQRPTRIYGFNTTKRQDLPEKRRLPSRHAHTHTIYAVRRVKAPGPSEHASEASPLAGISPVSFSVTRLVISNPPSPLPSTSLPPNQLAQAARAQRCPQYPAPEWREHSTRAPRRVRSSSSAPKKRRRFPPSA